MLQMRTEHLTDPLLVFPELASVARHIRADGVIVEGTLLALDEAGRPDPQLLRRRLAGIDAGPAEGAFVASDLIYRDGVSLAREPFVERRRQLASLITDSDHCVVGRGLAHEGTTLARAAASLGLGAISARMLGGRWRPGPSAGGWSKLFVTEPLARPTRPFLVLLERLPLDG
jgi:bifunctional non-homologous end joining protein LigD